MVLVLRRNPKCKVEKLKYRISPHEVLQSRLINTVFHNKGGGGLINFLPLKWGGGGLLERGGLFEGGGGWVNGGFTVCLLFVLALAYSRHSPQNTAS